MHSHFRCASSDPAPATQIFRLPNSPFSAIFNFSLNDHVSLSMLILGKHFIIQGSISVKWQPPASRREWFIVKKFEHFGGRGSLYIEVQVEQVWTCPEGWAFYRRGGSGSCTLVGLEPEPFTEVGAFMARSKASWVMVTWDPCGQTDTTENITFQQLCSRAINMAQ